MALFELVVEPFDFIFEFLFIGSILPLLPLLPFDLSLLLLSESFFSLLSNFFLIPFLEQLLPYFLSLNIPVWCLLVNIRKFFPYKKPLTLPHKSGHTPKKLS